VGSPGRGGAPLTYLQDWLKDKSFAAGDSVVFKYDVGSHSVLTVDEAAYTACTLTSPKLTSITGDDSLKLDPGPNYYICGIPGHCASGQKINITAAASASTPPTAGSNAAGTGVSSLYVLAAAVVAAVALW
jgi:hypothetical protein